jgi:heat shock protein HtpX
MRMIKNTFKTTILLAGLGGLMIVIGQSLGGGTGASIGLFLGIAMSFGSYWFSDKLALAASKAQPVDAQSAPELYRMVQDLTQRANLPMPRLFVIPSPQPNAFATGRNPEHAAVAVTQGILQTMDEQELKGVLAHELAHVKHRDILISSVASAIGMAVMFAARMAMFGAMFGGMGRDDRDGGGGAIGALATIILAPIAAMLIQMAISRSREFEADRGGAEMMGSGEPLARALEKLESASKQAPMNVHPAMAQAFIVNPLTGRNRPAFASLFSTHPATQERISRLRDWRP